MIGVKHQFSPVEVSRTATLLIVDPDRDLHQSLETAVQEFKLSLALYETSSRELKQVALADPPEVVLFHLTAAESCLDPFREMRQQWPDTRVIVVSELDDIHLYAEAIQLGAYDFLVKPLEAEELGRTLQRAIEPARTPCFAGLGIRY